MIASEDAVVGARVKWQSLNSSIPPVTGIITAVDKGRAFILCDVPDPDTGDYDSDTFLDSGASCWQLL